MCVGDGWGLRVSLHPQTAAGVINMMKRGDERTAEIRILGLFMFFLSALYNISEAK